MSRASGAAGWRSEVDRREIVVALEVVALLPQPTRTEKSEIASVATERRRCMETLRRFPSRIPWIWRQKTDARACPALLARPYGHATPMSRQLAPYPGTSQQTESIGHDVHPAQLAHPGAGS